MMQVNLGIFGKSSESCESGEYGYPGDADDFGEVTDDY